MRARRPPLYPLYPKRSIIRLIIASMSAKFKQRFGTFGVFAGLATLLVVLGVLQFRWSRQIRDAELERKQAALEAGVNGFREDFHRELAGICTNFSYPFPDQAATLETIYAQECGDWARSSEHRELVSNYYLWEKQKDNSYSFLRFNPQDDSFQAIACPAGLTSLCDPAKLASVSNPRGEFGFGSFRWRVEGASLTMLRPMLPPGWRDGRSRRPAELSPAGYMVVELNREVFTKRFLPELAQRYFAGPNGLVYDVALVDGATPAHFLYSSDAAPPAQLVNSPDQEVHLFNQRRWRTFEAREGNPSGPPQREHEIPPLRLGGPGRDRPGRPRVFLGALILADSSAAGWRLVVRHPGIPLAEAVVGYWRRDLFLGFGVLMVLAAGMALFLVWTQRIRRLAKMQMDFVAGVSHELRTPVSVISSAAENLADGVVDAKAQVKQYGSLIRNEAQRLGALVEQVLLFASTRDGKVHLEPRPIIVAETIDAAIADLEHLAKANGFTVEKHVAPDLPPVMADPKALSRCLQNLMTNAVKYGAAGRWMAVRAQPGVGPEAGEVLITVQDRGQGIEPGELPHIFDPFYRGNAARASQVHGTGLGLSLAKEAAEKMGGKLTVISRLGEGSAFTLHFPAARPAQDPAVVTTKLATATSDK